MKGTVEENILLAGTGNMELLKRIISIDEVGQQLTKIGGFTRFIDSDSQLSGGEKQFISLLQMVFHSRKWVLLDEPFSAMDKNMRSLSCKLIREYKSQENATLIIISHVIPEIEIDHMIHIG
jgi:ABC-type multidrug transport system ATPase subunit